MTPNRKRGRESPDDDLPESKKIHTAHIRGGSSLPPDPATQAAAAAVLVNAAWAGGGSGGGGGGGGGALLPDSPPSSVQSVEWNQPPAHYNPELSEAQNPFYYNSNKLLYEMYVARLERSSQ